jgi:hypothetical protein
VLTKPGDRIPAPRTLYGIIHIFLLAHARRWYPKTSPLRNPSSPKIYIGEGLC